MIDNKLPRTRLAKALEYPSKIPRLIRHSLARLYKLYIQRDEFTVAAANWFRDNGDKTRRLNYDLDSNSVVFDLGGYKGDFAHAINSKYGCTVYVFEPVKQFYLECVQRFSSNAKVKCFNYGLSDTNGSFFISDEDNGSSLTKLNTAKQTEMVSVRRFDEEIEVLGIKHIDLLKINVEGGEFLILPHIIKHNLISIIDNLQIQFHNFHPNAKQLRENIRMQFSVTHSEAWNYPFIWESWRIKKDASSRQPAKH